MFLSNLNALELLAPAPGSKAISLSQAATRAAPRLSLAGAAAGFRILINFGRLFVPVSLPLRARCASLPRRQDCFLSEDSASPPRYRAAEPFLSQFSFSSLRGAAALRRSLRLREAKNSSVRRDRRLRSGRRANSRPRSDHSRSQSGRRHA